MERLRKQYEPRLAGLYIEYKPNPRIVVRLAGLANVRSEFHNFNGNSLEVVFIPGAAHKLSHLQKKFDKALGRLQASDPAVQGGYVDERTGDIVVEILRGASRANVHAVALSSELAAPVRVIELTEPNQAQAVFGSGDIVYADGSINRICTNGFVVEHAGSTSYGVLTAGHCLASAGTYAYTGIDAAAHTLFFKARKYDSVADIAWVGAGSASVGPWFYANAWRQLTGRRTQASTAVGNQICKYGTNGGYGCATVFSVAYNPGPICGLSGTAACSATFVGLNSDGAANLCQGGDSGGPWFISTIAAGVHTAGNPSNGLCVYTSTDYAYSHLGLNLLY